MSAAHAAAGADAEHRFAPLVAGIRRIYGGEGPIALHRPVFAGNEKQYLADCIDSNFVSSVGAKVGEFEQSMARFIGSRFAVATVNGTAALHVALRAPRSASTASSPPVGAASPATRRSSVVLPEPFGPVTTRKPPRPSSRSSGRSARRAP